MAAEAAAAAAAPLAQDEEAPGPPPPAAPGAGRADGVAAPPAAAPEAAGPGGGPPALAHVGEAMVPTAPGLTVPPVAPPAPAPAPAPTAAPQATAAAAVARAVGVTPAGLRVRAEMEMVGAAERARLDAQPARAARALIPAVRALSVGAQRGRAAPAALPSDEEPDFSDDEEDLDFEPPPGTYMDDPPSATALCGGLVLADLTRLKLPFPYTFDGDGEAAAEVLRGETVMVPPPHVKTHDVSVEGRRRKDLLGRREADPARRTFLLASWASAALAAARGRTTSAFAALGAVEDGKLVALAQEPPPEHLGYFSRAALWDVVASLMEAAVTTQTVAERCVNLLVSETVAGVAVNCPQPSAGAIAMEDRLRTQRLADAGLGRTRPLTEEEVAMAAAMKAALVKQGVQENALIARSGAAAAIATAQAAAAAAGGARVSGAPARFAAPRADQSHPFPAPRPLPAAPAAPPPQAPRPASARTPAPRRGPHS